MKKITTLIWLIVLTIGLSNTAFAYNEPDTAECLKISGRIMNLKNKFDGRYKVELITSKGIIDSVNLKDNKQFKFYLKKNSYYAIRITKKGYLERIVSIYTDIPANTEEYFGFRFDTELIEESASQQLNKDALDFPVAIVHYNEKMKCFYHCEKYTNDLKKKMYKHKPF